MQMGTQKVRKPSLVLFTACTILFAMPLHALEINASFELGNLGFTPARTSVDTTFAGADYLWGGFLSVTEEISDSFLLEVRTSRDMILGNTLISSFTYRTDYFTLGVGSFLGFLNSASLALKSGVSTDIQLELPGIITMSVHTENSLGSTLRDPGDFTQTLNEITLDFYVPNAICALSMNSKEFALNAGAYQTIDSLTDCSLRIQVYEKNVPLRLHIAFCYQILSKEFIDGATNPVHSLNSLVFGTGLDLIFSSTSIMGFQPFLFQGSTGFRLSFPTSKDQSEI
jgi:hypothetical protein